MTRTATLRRQHDIILDKAQVVQECARTLDDAGAVRRLLREFHRFDAVLTAHLKAEDGLLYPEMIASGDPHTATTASHFSAEMGGLASVYGDFVRKWAGEASILADPEGFRSEFRRIIFALSSRIHRENSELYPLADAIDDIRTRDQQRRRA